MFYSRILHHDKPLSIVDFMESFLRNEDKVNIRYDLLKVDGDNYYLQKVAFGKKDDPKMQIICISSAISDRSNVVIYFGAKQAGRWMKPRKKKTPASWTSEGSSKENPDTKNKQN